MAHTSPYPQHLAYAWHRSGVSKCSNDPVFHVHVHDRLNLITFLKKTKYQ